MLDFEHLKLIKGAQVKEIVNVERHNLPYPSLNEVNFLAFNESDDGYHNELYGYIESEGWLADYKAGKQTRPYTRLKNNGQTQQEQKILSEYIRHLIHHPENTHNHRFSTEELGQSISEMRTFILGKQNAQTVPSVPFRVFRGSRIRVYWCPFVVPTTATPNDEV